MRSGKMVMVARVLHPSFMSAASRLNVIHPEIEDGYSHNRKSTECVQLMNDIPLFFAFQHV